MRIRIRIQLKGWIRIRIKIIRIRIKVLRIRNAGFSILVKEAISQQMIQETIGQIKQR
jgi:hypothetical protein